MSFLRAALYEKNVPSWERVLRVVIAVGGTAASFVLLPSPWSWVSAVSAIGFGVTGLVGFCPACAMVGRRLQKS